jgi:membrane-associated protein
MSDITLIFSDLYQFLFELINLYDKYFFLIIFIIIFSETGLVIFPFLPGDSLLFLSGVISGLGMFDINFYVVVCIFAAVLGNQVNFFIGREFGKKMMNENLFSRYIKKSHLEKTSNFFNKHGKFSIILARFIPIIRTYIPFLAGIGLMDKKIFFVYNVIGALLWVLTLSYLGFFFGDSDVVRNNLGLVTLLIIILSLLPLIKFLKKTT